MAEEKKKGGGNSNSGKRNNHMLKIYNKKCYYLSNFT